MPYKDTSRYYDIPGQHHRRAGVDRQDWTRFVQRLTGSTDARSDAAAKQMVDPVVAAVARRGQTTIRQDTPIDTGRLFEGWEVEQNAPADHSIINRVEYAPIVESRQPGGPAKYHGAMMNQNRAKIEADLVQSIERFVEEAAR